MKYYFIKDRIVTSENELLDYVELTDEQKNFYLSNQNASALEVKLLTLKDYNITELKEKKEVKHSELNSNYKEKLDEGFVDSGYTEYVLSGDDESFQNLQKLTDRLSLKAQLNTLADHTQMFTDKNGAVQSLSGQACLEMLDRYSDWYEQLYFANKVKQSQIEACSTIQELYNLDLAF